MIAPDKKTYEFLKEKPFTPKGVKWEKAMEYWSTLYSDESAIFDKEYVFKGENIEPMITYGTNPGMGIGLSKKIPKSTQEGEKSHAKSLNYMGFSGGESMVGKKIDFVFLIICFVKILFL